MWATTFTLIALLIPVYAVVTMFGFGKSKWDPRGKHCFVTGGSAGLGLALAVLLTKRGAHVSIVARNQERLDKALQQLESARQDPSQILTAISFSVDNAKDAAASIDAASAAHGNRTPDAMFLCAGAAKPGFFVEQTEESFKGAMESTYWAQAWSAFAGAKRMVQTKTKGKIIFVSSILGYMSMVGYSTYSPGKFAIRGLAESLRSELMLYGIDVHICFPATIFSPGYDEENKTKPKVTLKIEEGDDGATPEHVAASLLKGVEKSEFHITYNFILDVFRASTRGSSPGNNFLIDMVYALIGAFALPVWRRSVDSTVRQHTQEHQEYLIDREIIRL